MSQETVFPDEKWEFAEPEDAGMYADKVADAQRKYAEAAGEKKYRVVVVRSGKIVAEWNQGIEADEHLNMASANKGLYSSMLGIAVAEGKIGSPDDKLAKYFREFMDVPAGHGPKPGRFAKPEDKDITLRQLISNTSGYMKPGETPGKQYHYQTFGMNVFCHAIEMAYGVYDSSGPDRLPGIGKLIEEKIRNPIGGKWPYRYTDFEHPEGAYKHIFGHSARCDATCREMARMGLLWLHFGNWAGKQIIPEDWMRQASRTAPDIKANCPQEQWKYGHGFWTNDYGLLWPNLSRASFAASGAGQKHIWVCPDLDLVVAQSPGIHDKEQDEPVNRMALENIAAALK